MSEMIQSRRAEAEEYLSSVRHCSNPTGPILDRTLRILGVGEPVETRWPETRRAWRRMMRAFWDLRLALAERRVLLLTEKVMHYTD